MVIGYIAIDNQYKDLFTRVLNNDKQNITNTPHVLYIYIFFFFSVATRLVGS